MNEQTYLAVESLKNAIEVLDNHAEIMFAYIPLQTNECLTRFIDNIQRRELTANLSHIYNDVTSEIFEELFPPDSSLLILEECDYFGEYALKTNPSLRFNALSGKIISLDIPKGFYIHDSAVQCNNARAINHEKHRDQNSVYTINIYAQGRGLNYDISGESVSVPSPVITIHRGVQHALGTDAAVMHQGQEQTNDRVNQAFQLKPDPPHAG